MGGNGNLTIKFAWPNLTEYSTEKLSVRLSVMLIAQLFLHGSMLDEHDIIPTSSGISMPLSKRLYEPWFVNTSPQKTPTSTIYC